MNCHFDVTRDFIAPVLAVGISDFAIRSSLSEIELWANSDSGSGQSGALPICHSALRLEIAGNGPAPIRDMTVAGIAALLSGLGTRNPAGAWPGYQTTS